MTCPRCGNVVEPSHRFCEECGLNLRQTRTPVGGPLGAAAACRGCGGDSFGPDGFCEQCGHVRPSGRDRMMADLGLVAGLSDRGRRRSRNEDSMACGVAFGAAGQPGPASAVVAVVCDGVASTERADSASQVAADQAADILLEAAAQSDFDAEAATSEAVAAAFEAVTELKRADESPSCTYVSAVVTGTEVTVGWLGDSRAYWIGDALQSEQLTTDDTVVSLLIAAGISEEDALNDPGAHALARWVGADAEEREPHVRTCSPAGSGVIVLCSDGLWNYLPTLGSLDAAVRADPRPPSQRSPSDLVDALVALALESGGHDNVTVVAVPFPIGDGGTT
ncbi:protein phosphatase 2C domain-containing protein [Fodinicola acaciae]|uniref:protein phosphatase 2C domain-containing protein n=1 Tax=Fodinicola acaciae TaxID=2681555 RepID=UPI0013CF79C7|nr:protein phosphatase 2C domain-containing protein [Fodinicola acaciae]